MRGVVKSRVLEVRQVHWLPLVHIVEFAIHTVNLSVESRKLGLDVDNVGGLNGDYLVLIDCRWLNNWLHGSIIRGLTLGILLGGGFLLGGLLGGLFGCRLLGRLLSRLLGGLLFGGVLLCGLFGGRLLGRLLCCRLLFGLLSCRLLLGLLGFRLLSGSFLLGLLGLSVLLGLLGCRLLLGLLSCRLLGVSVLLGGVSVLRGLCLLFWLLFPVFFSCLVLILVFSDWLSRLIDVNVWLFLCRLGSVGGCGVLLLQDTC